MADLLIHSVSEFSDLILEALKLADARTIVEIGAEYGGMSALLAEHCRALGGQFTTIDPAPKRQFLDWLSANPDVHHLAKTSLEAFAALGRLTPGSSMVTTTGTRSIMN
jgi:predicted O-methyltransferase YrrM